MENLTEDKLIKFSREHLYYEVWIFYGIGNILVKGITDIYIQNALLESFIMHARVLLDFLYSKKQKTDDAIANDYLDKSLN